MLQFSQPFFFIVLRKLGLVNKYWYCRWYFNAPPGKQSLKDALWESLCGLLIGWFVCVGLQWSLVWRIDVKSRWSLNILVHFGWQSAELCALGLKRVVEVFNHLQSSLLFFFFFVINNTCLYHSLCFVENWPFKKMLQKYRCLETDVGFLFLHILSAWWHMCTSEKAVSFIFDYSFYQYKWNVVFVRWWQWTSSHSDVWNWMYRVTQKGWLYS